MSPLVLFDFEEKSNIQDWMIINDGVMGGLSKGELTLTHDGYGQFKGIISLENFGGFSSMRLQFNQINIEKYSAIRLRIKGDGKQYQFRLKSNLDEYQSYIQYFETSGKWEIIELNLNDFYPSFRGRKLSMANYPGKFLEEVSFLIGNKKAEEFNLLIDKIELK